MTENTAHDDHGTEIKVGATTCCGGEIMEIIFDPEPGCACVVVLYHDDPGETADEERWSLRQPYNMPSTYWICDEVVMP